MSGQPERQKDAPVSRSGQGRFALGRRRGFLADSIKNKLARTLPQDMKTSRLVNQVCRLGLALVTSASSASAANTGILYTTDNAAAGNHVQVITRSGSTLSLGAAYATGGLGSGTSPGLPSQGSVLLSPDARWLFVCNAGSDDISVFETLPSGQLQLTDKVNSGGRNPVSLTLNGSLLYVLNAGGAMMDQDNVTAFHFGCGNLTMLAGSSRTLSAANTGPAQVSFSRDGDTLVVTEKGTSLIDTWVLDHDGMAMDHKTAASSGATPYGFAAGRGNRLFVSEAAGGAANASSVSSYTLSDAGSLAVITASAATEQTAACWLAVTFDGRYLYTANAGAGTLTGFRIQGNGSLVRLETSGVGATIGNGTHPADMAFSHDGHLLFTLNNGNGTVSGFMVKSDGSLESTSSLSGLPVTSAGLAAW